MCGGGTIPEPGRVLSAARYSGTGAAAVSLPHDSGMATAAEILSGVISHLHSPGILVSLVWFPRLLYHNFPFRLNRLILIQKHKC